MKTLHYTVNNPCELIIHYKDNSEFQAVKLCMESIKKNYLNIDSFEIKKNSSEIESVYDLQTIERWINLLKNHNLNINYKIDKTNHSIFFHYSDYKTISEVYITLLLIRYLWYFENNFLIYRIFDILDKTNFSFFQALCLSHYYDNIKRDSTFNIFRLAPINKYSLSFDSFLDCLKYEYNIHDFVESKLISNNFKQVDILRNIFRNFKFEDYEYKKAWDLLLIIYSIPFDEKNTDVYNFTILNKLYNLKFKSFEIITDYKKLLPNDVVGTNIEKYTTLFTVSDDQKNILSFDKKIERPLSSYYLNRFLKFIK